MAKVEVELFTHPICTGCWDTKKMLEEVVRELEDLVEWKEWSLAVPSGRARAQACGVLEVPTIIIQKGERIVGVPRDAAALRERIMAAAVGTAAGKGA